MSDRQVQSALEDIHDPTIAKEFLVNAELFVSNALGTGLRKAAPPRKRPADKRESLAGNTNDVDLKEKSSWMFLRTLAGGGQWRPATCKLTEESSRCLLNIYVDESILVQTVYIHLLDQTNIRLADNSLFFRKDCICIYSIAGQRWTSMNVVEPLYLHFSTPDLCITWLALMKSYTIAETHGRWFFPLEGGSYRMWRQVNLTINQGRNLGAWPSEPKNNPNNADESIMDADASDADVSCEMFLNDILCGRTTVKRGISSPEWHEQFSFTDLPPFDDLQIYIWRERKLYKPQLIGKVHIALANFRRGEAIDGWFPVLHSTDAIDVHHGELRLKITVEEELILPYSEYSNLLRTFSSRNFLDWMSDFDNKLKLTNIRQHLMILAITNDVMIDQVEEFAYREMEGGSISHNTMFRGNTIFTQCMEQCMGWYGKSFLEASIGSVVRRLQSEKVAIEVDPMRSGKSAKDLEKSVEQLLFWCQEFWNQIYSARAQCPNELRRLFATIRKAVGRRYETAVNEPQESHSETPQYVQQQSVSVFCFLRFLVPAILHPHLFGLCSGLPSTPVKRSLTLIAKVIQSLANLTVGAQKESFMNRMKDFLTASQPTMVDYINDLSTLSTATVTQPGDMWERHNKLAILVTIRQRALRMPILCGESIPMPPNLLDIPRTLAVVVSAVLRSFRESDYISTSPDREGTGLEEFITRCLEIESAGLARVKLLANKMSDVLQPTLSATPETSPIHARMSSLHVAPALETPQSRQTIRPRTAPSTSDRLTPIRRSDYQIQNESRPFAARTFVPDESEPRTFSTSLKRQGHSKSPSTETMHISTSSVPRRLDNMTDVSDDVGKWKKGIFKNLLRLT